MKSGCRGDAELLLSPSFKAKIPFTSRTYSRIPFDFIEIFCVYFLFVLFVLLFLLIIIIDVRYIIIVGIIK